MGNRIRRAIATLAITGAAVAGIGLAGAGEAQARVNPGNYTFSTQTWLGTHGVTPVRVQGNVLTFYNATHRSHLRIIGTPNGGYADLPNFGRVTLRHVGNGVYKGRTYFFGVDSGGVTLRPR